jgi:hypothetical protein
MIILDSHIWFWWINQELHRFSVTILEAIKTNRFLGFFQAVFFIDGALTLLLIGGFRLLIRYIYSQYRGREQANREQYRR